MKIAMMTPWNRSCGVAILTWTMSFSSSRTQSHELLKLWPGIREKAASKVASSFIELFSSWG